MTSFYPIYSAPISLAALPAGDVCVFADLLYNKELGRGVARRVAEAKKRGSWIIVVRKEEGKKEGMWWERRRYEFGGLVESKGED